MSYQKPRTRLFALLAAAALLPLAAIPSNAQSARQLLSGSTTLALDSGLVTGLTDSGVVVSSNAPATLNGTTAVFPVVSGGVDQDTLTGVVYHSGGITFTASAENIVVTVSQLALVNALSGQPAQLYGLVTVNGKVAGLYPLFNITTRASLPLSGSTVTLPAIHVTLSSQGASLLNNAFGFNGFSSGQVIGVASLQAAATTYIVPKTQPVQ
jgi:hypothetical protein